MLRRACLLAATVAVAGCGGGDDARPKPAARQASPYTAIDPRANRAVLVTPKTLAKPIAAYKRHVRRQLTRMLGDVRALNAAIAAHDLAGARRAWLRAYARYETIGAAYGAFGDLDAAINGRPGGLQGGTASRHFAGLHRIELALWQRASTRDAARPARRLVRDVARLRASVGKSEIDPLDFGLRAHEILEDTIHLALAGRASPWAGAALVALEANIAGTRIVMRELGPIAEQSNRLAVQLSLRALDRLDRAVHALRRDGRLPRWDAVSQRERERINGLTAAAAEQLAYVPGLVDPRPPLPVKPAIEATTR